MIGLKVEIRRVGDAHNNGNKLKSDYDWIESG